MRLYTTILLAALVSLALVLLGYWWAPFAIGVLTGVIIGRLGIAAATGAAIGLASWLIPLAVAHSRYGLGPTATALAAIMGFDAKPAVPVVLTLLVATLFGVSGAWLGAAARGLTPWASGDSFRRTKQAGR